MKRFLCLALLSSVLSMNSYADLNLTPKTHIRFYCQNDLTDQNDLMATDGSNTKVIQAQMVAWVGGLPKAGCTQQVINEITQNGYYCDGHYLANYKQDPEQEFADVASCEGARAAQPSVEWN